MDSSRSQPHLMYASEATHTLTDTHTHNWRTPYMFIIAPSGGVSWPSRGSYNSWAENMALGRTRASSDGLSTNCHSVRGTQVSGSWWSRRPHDWWLYQPLQILTGSDCIETGDKLARSFHRKLLWLQKKTVKMNDNSIFFILITISYLSQLNN